MSPVQCFKRRSVNDGYSDNIVSNSSEDFEASFLGVKNREPELEIHSKDLAAFSESIGKSRQQEDFHKMQGNGKGTKRKARETERKVDQEWRIVSFSRLTGGKDRHSKVVTAKGLRDRRVRLSVPTAIQLYDLQDRLGYEQPSKAVDWLVKAAKSAIDELPVLDSQMTSPSAGNVAQLTSSNYSNVDDCVGSPRKSATAVTAPDFTAFRVGLDFAKAEVLNTHKAINGKAKSITTLNGSDLGRSSSSISDGSTKGSGKHTSICSMSEPTSRIQVRLKESELGTKKLVLPNNSDGSPPVIHQLKSMQPVLNGCLFKSVLPYALPFESQCSKDDNSRGIHTQILSGRGNVQQLWDYNRLSYTDMLSIPDFQPLQNVSSSSTTSLQMSFPPVPSTPASTQALIGGSSLQSYEMADSAISFFDPKQSRPFAGNSEQGLSSRGPHQSISSSIISMPCFSHSHKNAYGESSSNAAHDPFEDYEARAFQGFHYA